jgi:hypothetical protein
MPLLSCVPHVNNPTTVVPHVQLVQLMLPHQSIPLITTLITMVTVSWILQQPNSVQVVKQVVGLP